jgi:hypothetical protein
LEEDFSVAAPPAGLCDTCKFCRRVETARSVFFLCERSFTDAAYPRYPLLPVIVCPGYDPQADPPGEG